LASNEAPGAQFMAKRQKYRDGKPIFREGEASTCAYVIKEGEVELTKVGPKGTMRLAVLKTGELFGEMGLLDNSPRSASARAIGPVTLEIISREEFLTMVRENPKQAVAVMEKLVTRLRKADEMLVGKSAVSKAVQPAQPALLKPQGQAAATVQSQPSPQQSRPAAPPQKPGFFSRLMGRPGPATENATPLTVTVAELIGDEGGVQGKIVMSAFEGQEGVTVKAIKKPLKPEENGTDGITGQLAALAAKGRKMLAGTRGDILIWGALTEDKRAVRLRFLSALEDDDDRPGAFGTATALDLPLGFQGDLAGLLHAVTLAATVPRTERLVQHIRTHLPRLLDACKAVGRKPPLDLDKNSQGAMMLCFANAAAAAGWTTGNLDWFSEAQTAYQAAIRTLARSSSRYDGAVAHKQLGVVLQILGEKKQDDGLLTEAAKAFVEAQTVLTREDFPIAWANLQNRRGLLAYKMDMRDSTSTESAQLKQAITAFQGALTVYTMAETPLKWAETKHNLGQALQILGGQARSPDLLNKAIEAGRDALEVRTRERFPLPWAATMNSLGSALFLLAKFDEQAVEELVAAAEAFQGAIDVYITHGLTKTAKIAERNLEKVERMLEARQPDAKPLGTFNWDDEDDSGITL